MVVSGYVPIMGHIGKDRVMGKCGACGVSLWAWSKVGETYCPECVTSGQAEYDRLDRLGKGKSWVIG